MNTRCRMKGRTDIEGLSDFGGTTFSCSDGIGSTKEPGDSLLLIRFLCLRVGFSVTNSTKVMYCITHIGMVDNFPVQKCIETKY